MFEALPSKPTRAALSRAACLSARALAETPSSSDESAAPASRPAARFSAHRLPVAEQLFVVAQPYVAEDVRVAAHHLRVDGLDHVGDGELAALAGDLRRRRSGRAGRPARRAAQAALARGRPPRKPRRLPPTASARAWRMSARDLTGTLGRAQPRHQCDEVTAECGRHDYLWLKVQNARPGLDDAEMSQGRKGRPAPGSFEIRACTSISNFELRRRAATARPPFRIVSSRVYASCKIFYK